MSADLEGEIRKSLEHLGFRIANSPEGADYKLMTDLRGWWARSARFALITTITLTLYTPLDYKWILNVDLLDDKDNTVALTHERGGFRFHTFAIAFFPATVFEYHDLVVPHWSQIARRSAHRSLEFMLAQLSRQITAPDATSSPSPIER